MTTSSPSVGQLLRLQKAAEAAQIDNPDGAAAPALTGAYARLRSDAFSAIAEPFGLGDEFNRLLPEIEVVPTPATSSSFNDVRATHALGMSGTPKAREAQSLLKQLSGWLEGLVEEQMIGQRIQAEAKAKADLVTKQQTGFTAPTE